MTSLYSQIERDLVNKIEQGELAPGDPVPTEIELCGIYGVSRITVRRAVERLVAARMIYRRRGIGTFVSKSSVDGRRLHLTGRIKDVLTFDKNLTARVLQRGMAVAPPLVREAFGPSAPKLLYAIGAVNALDGKPYAITRSFLAPELSALGPKIEITDGRTAIREIEGMTDLRVRSGRQSIRAATASEPVATELGVKRGSPVLMALRVFFAAGEHPIEAVMIHYHPDRYQIDVDLVASDSFAS